MVRVWGANMSDVTDRPERSIGTPSAITEGHGLEEPLYLSQPRGVLGTPMPWSAHYPWGRVILHDDFESTLKWKQSLGTVTRANDAEFVHGDLYSMKMVTGAIAGNGAGGSIFRQPLRSDSTYAVLEFHWALSAVADATPRNFFAAWINMDQNLAHGHQFGIKLLHHSAGAFQRQLQYIDGAGVWSDIVGVTYKIPVETAMWNYLVIVLKHNVATGWQYYWGRLNDVEFMMNTLACQPIAYVSPYQSVMLECTTDAAAATTAYVDDLTLLDMVQLHIS